MIGLLLLLLASPSTGETELATLTGSGDFYTKQQALTQLRRLNADDAQVLLDWVAKPTGEPGEAVLKNDALNLIRAQANPPRALAQTLIAIFRDPAHSEQMRDYALQHLGTWLPYASEREPIRHAFEQALSETQSSVAGTAMLALLRSPKLGQDLLRDSAQTIAADQSAGHLARITALRICGQLNLTGALKTAEDLAQNGPLALQPAAIATLGELGDASHLPMLIRIIAQSDPRLTPAAQRAITMLNSRGTRSGS